MKQSIKNKIIFKPSTKIREVLEVFEKTAVYTESKGFGVIINNRNECVAVVTEGDIRTYLLKNGSLDDNISKAMNSNFSYVNKNESAHRLIRHFDNGISNLPIISNKKKLIDVVGYSNIYQYIKASPLIVRARVPLRISFSGGGTDFSSYMNKSSTGVLTSTINKYVTASVIVRSDDIINIYSRDLDISESIKDIDRVKYNKKLDLIKSAIKLSRPNFGFDIETYSDVGPGTGLGGSSALIAATIGVLNYFKNEKTYDLYKIADLAYQAERIELSIKGGWQDQYATTFGGFNWIDFNSREIIVSPLRIHKDILLELEYNLMLFNLGGNRNSSTIHEKNINAAKNKKNKIENAYKEMSDIAENMKNTLLKGDLKGFGDQLDYSWQAKKKLNIQTSNKKIDLLYSLAKKYGALGGKLLGAGQNGFMLIYASPLYQKKIIKAFSSKGCTLENFNFTNSGLDTWTVER